MVLMRTVIFIDGLTLYHALKNDKIDFSKFKQWLIKDDECKFAGYYNCVVDKRNKKSFFTHVYKSGFDLFIYNPIYSSSHKKHIIYGVDIGITMNAIEKINEYDKLILVSGKYVFLPLCERLSLKGKLIEIVGYKNTINNVYSKYKQRYIDDFLILKKNRYINM
jgi:uncharacterized LabA/DUF88 family protein